ncbi:Gfo/Idh/MocA family protein [Vibrio mediterranei]|jgi:predicted dehydrogenase|uniref:Oxidoreductase n=1 Tax=Vibrio mediterranei TaxID=689 RepID=A0ABX5DF17_9VIBR|nr:Gfo/Idh/MocA family oxidoreductase [Vibrio mediterranei]MCG9657875.1 Gfo/Idh/MocA family oxidoreductase [Vibrio mediterranei]MCG9665276.1 Gfo/Idh/MocA family oxidoreductase [Vibrio mediterranei]PCD87946.1 oxidoreductase [Vibrio mediterranei]PRQ67211.1 oxidoreductase [Vibrio mediterranei]
MLEKARWGIAGLGKIARRFAIDLTQHSQCGELVAVAARDEARASKFAEEFECSRSYGSYQALADDADVDVVYVATLHPYHRDLVELFLSAGKHVLVEKPAFTNVKDWDEMAALAIRHGVILAEAMKSVVFPAYQELKHFIVSNNIKLTSVQAAFGNWHEYDENYQIFNAQQAGGATLDVGVYALWLYADLCTLCGVTIGKPDVVFSQDNPQAKVDETAEFHFKSGLQGQLAASITRNLVRSAVIQGEDFEATIAEKWWNPKSIQVVYRGETVLIAPQTIGTGFEHEIDHLSGLILQGAKASSILKHETSRAVIGVMEQSLIAGGLGYLSK